MLARTEAGEAGAPALVLLHAGIADRGMWDELLAPLAAEGLRVIALDLPGFGESPAGHAEPWEAVLATLDELGVASAAIAGSSYGGAVALRCVAKHRGRFWALSTACSPAPGLEPSPALEERWEAEETALAAGDLAGAAQAVARDWLLPEAPHDLRERITAMQRQAFALQAAAPATNGGGDHDPIGDDPERLQLLTTPALVLAGERDLPDFTEGAKLMARLLPSARLELIAGAGHLPPLETPAAYLSLLALFLAEHRPAA